MEIPYLLIFIATLTQFILGGLWYGPLFGKMWMEIMGVDCSKEDMLKAEKKMGPMYAIQMVITLITTFILAMFIQYVMKADATFTPYCVAGMIWLGFMAPIQISGVIWGATKRELQFKQILISISGQLVGIMLAAFILSF